MLDRLIGFVSRYKLFHIGFWLWSTAGLMHNFLNRPRTVDRHAYEEVVVVTVMQMACVYFVWWRLIPRYLHAGRYVLFAASTLASVIGSALLNVLLRDAYLRMTAAKHLTNASLLVVVSFVDTLITTLVFIAVAMLGQGYFTDRRNKELEKERLETELNFLRAQINPHFLFNALNSIYVLIHLDKKTASDTLLKFSGLLRYHLYECKHDAMPLERELNFLNDYIKLETIRNDDQLHVTYEPPRQAPPFPIAPFLLVPFVENAFKHVSRHTDRVNFVRIQAEVKDNTLHFAVSNSFDDAPPAKRNGIGLANVARRLELLYPKRHKLAIDKSNGVYHVDLQLFPYENQLPRSR